MAPENQTLEGKNRKLGKWEFKNDPPKSEIINGRSLSQI